MFERIGDDATPRVRRALLEELAALGRADAALFFALADVDGTRHVADADFVGHGSAARILSALAREPGLLPARLVDATGRERANGGSFLDGASTRWSHLLAGTAFRRRVLAPIGVRDLARRVVVDGERIVGCVVALRCSPERAFGRRDRERLEGVAQRLDRCIRETDVELRASHPREANAFLVVRGPEAAEIEFASPAAAAWRAHPDFEPVLDAAIRAATDRNESVRVFRLVEIRVTRLEGPAGRRWLVRVRSSLPARRTTDGALSPLQRVVARDAAAGATIAEIAVSLGRAPETVRSHLRAAYARLGVSSRVELARRLGS